MAYAEEHPAEEHSTEERVSIELVDAGGHKDRVVMVLSKVKGLTMPAQQLVQHMPCTIATDVPLSSANKLKEYLEKAGAMVMLEREPINDEEEELFTADDFPIADESQNEDADDLLEFEAPASDLGDASDIETDDDLTFTTDEIVEPPELLDMPNDDDDTRDADPKRGVFGKLLGQFPAIGKKKIADIATDDDADARMESESDGTVPKKPSWAFLEKLRKPKSAADDGEFPESGEKKTPSDFLRSPVAYMLIGLLAGAILTGLWGWLGIQKQRQELVDYEIQTAQQIEDHSAQLKNMVAQLTQKAESLQLDNSDLQTQNAALIAEIGEAQKRPAGIMPTDSPLEMMPWEDALVQEFQPLMERHAQILEDGYAAQQQAGCSQQVLLDGNGTLTYAQVVKHFNARYTRYDIRRSDSLMTPYIAEFKIPFQQEIRTGATQAACEAATLQTFDLPDHHEFGGYYGYWTLEYAYTDGAWHLKTTVIERNRDLYAASFQKGSPDYAKFKIDTAVFPGLEE